MSPRKTNQQKKDDGHTAKGKQRVKWQGYVNYTPTEQDRAGLSAAIDGGFDAEHESMQIMREGYRLSMGFDEYHGCYSASLYCQNSSSTNAGWNLSVRATDPFTAFTRLVYLHVYVLGGDWNTAQSGGWSDENW